MGISQISWAWLLKATPMYSYTYRGHTQRMITQTQACNDCASTGPMPTATQGPTAGEGHHQGHIKSCPQP